jgi:hypothetical protein
MWNFSKKHKRKALSLLCVFIAIAVIFGAAAIYLGDYYHADNGAIGAMLPEGSSWKETPDKTIVFEPDGATKGFIFYPGGKVEYTAYIPLMAALAEKGVLCIIVEMPFNLAVLDVNAADGIREDYPEITEWYIGGHSLGGSMAASYAAKNAEDFAGLVLLASYSTENISESGLSVLSVYGSEDGVLDREKYEASRKNLPAQTEELVIEGGCHAYFGMYGAQQGDGTPRLTPEEQIRITAKAIADFTA